MTRKPKLMQFLRKLQEIQAKYIDTVGIEIRSRRYLDDGVYAINASFISQTRKCEDTDAEDNSLVVNATLYSFWTNKENKKAFDGFVKEVKVESQLVKEGKVIE